MFPRSSTGAERPASAAVFSAESSCARGAKVGTCKLMRRELAPQITERPRLRSQNLPGLACGAISWAQACAAAFAFAPARTRMRPQVFTMMVRRKRTSGPTRAAAKAARYRLESPL